MKLYADNKKARFDYEIIETYEAGLVLSGNEVKSIRNGNISLKGGFITFHNQDAFLTNVHIPRYKYAGNLLNYDPERSRKLLLKKKEISYLRGKSQEKGLTIVPLTIYNKGRHIKIEIAVVKGKKKYDKRESIKKREVNRELQRKMKSII
ncbi:MAG TPA: SsrA-binding protein SmpB [Candidatus Magasanikbacteria bacterium]|nr:SsrA-binding protein SmpB [Candidatus Magasanikbacteria bacterium]